MKDANEKKVRLVEVEMRQGGLFLFIFFVSGIIGENVPKGPYHQTKKYQS